MSSTATARTRVVTYLVLTFALSSIFYWQIIAAGRMGMLPVLGLMWCPGVAALITKLVFQRSLRGIGWGWGATRWQVLAYVLPPALAAGGRGGCGQKGSGRVS